jgi:phosphatidylinositol alpha-mannosyltransferase
VRIALACPYAWDAPGGVQVHVRQLAMKLRERGHAVVVLTPAATAPEESFVRRVGRPFRIPYNRSVAPIAPTGGAFGRVRRELRRFQPDLVHVHEPMVPGPAMFAALASEAPVVATFHAYADRARLFDLAAPALRRVWERLAARVAVSEAAAEFVAQRFDADDLQIIPNGADVELFGKAEPARLPAGRPILFVNRLDRRKGFPVMVQAFRRLAASRSDVLLVVAGDGTDRSAIRDLPVEHRARVVMLGNVPHGKLPRYHAASKVFCAPSTGRESFGIVLVEAMAAGLPVVASDIPGYREVIRDGAEGILVRPGDPEALARATEHLLDEGRTAKRLAAAGRERARRFSWDVVAEEVEELYRDVAGA